MISQQIANIFRGIPRWVIMKLVFSFITTILIVGFHSCCLLFTTPLWCDFVVDIRYSKNVVAWNLEECLLRMNVTPVLRLQMGRSWGHPLSDSMMGGTNSPDFESEHKCHLLEQLIQQGAHTCINDVTNSCCYVIPQPTLFQCSKTRCWMFAFSLTLDAHNVYTYAYMSSNFCTAVAVFLLSLFFVNLASKSARNIARSCCPMNN